MPSSSAIQAALLRHHQAVVATLPSHGNPSTVSIQLGTHATSPVEAAIDVEDMQMKSDDSGKAYRVEPCTVRVVKSLLPAWATVEALPGRGKCRIADKVYKISTARDTGVALELVCLRWPDD